MEAAGSSGAGQPAPSGAAVLKAETPSFSIDADSSRAGVFKDYAALGVEHILLGLPDGAHRYRDGGLPGALLRHPDAPCGGTTLLLGVVQP